MIFPIYLTTDDGYLITTDTHELIIVGYYDNPDIGTTVYYNPAPERRKMNLHSGKTNHRLRSHKGIEY